MISRRTALTGMAAAASATAAGLPSGAMTNAGDAVSSGKLTAASSAATVGIPMNRARAEEILERDGLDALVLGQGINVYHASGFWPLTSRMGHSPNTFAIVTRRKAQPLSLVLPSFTYYYLLADIHRSDDFPAYIYTSPADEEGPDGAPLAAPFALFPDRKAIPLDSVESRRGSLTAFAEKGVGLSADAKLALAKALKDLGLTKARIAVDHQNVHALVTESAPGATLVDADDALRRIRPIKSNHEIALMRRAATNNAEAALAAAHAVRAGASYRDLRNLFYAEAAQRGNKGVFMVVDRVSAEQYDAPFRDGQAFLIDAVSEFGGYHGDYGRTIFLGEPPRPMAQAVAAIGTAWDEIRHALKPGMRFSEIGALGQQTLKKLGGNYIVPFGPHSVGLYHTDHVGNAGAAALREDHVLEKGMILSVDCPLLESGMGGSAHLEDLMLITENGSEPINNVGDQVIII
jgi:Xaa-Pro aminopeptidase